MTTGDCEHNNQGGKPRSFAARTDSHFTSSFEILPEPKVREQTLCCLSWATSEKANRAFSGKTVRRELRSVPRAAPLQRNLS
jgi:hypothetical protein